MTNEEKVRWLQRYQMEVQREKELASELLQLRARATAISVHIDGMPKGKTDSDIILIAVASIIEVEKELENQIRRCNLVRERIIEAIASIPKEREQLILRYRYIAGYRWDRIAEEMNMCSRWCKVLHDKAVSLL